MSFDLDSKKWDIYHQKTQSEDTLPSKYAQQCELKFPKGSIIVDLGGGVGADALYFLEKGHSVIILDISEYALNTATERAKKKKLDTKLITKQVDFSLHSIPLKADSVDIAYSRLSLNYFDKKETSNLLHDVNNILKPGGKAYITFKSPNDINEFEYLKKRATLMEENVFIDNGQVRSRFSTSQLEEICKEADLTNFEVKEYAEDVGEKTTPGRIIPCNELTFTKVSTAL